MKRQTISAVIVVFNEERNIAECLETAKWMDEIVVVDAFSTDQTINICGQFTNKIYQRQWRGFGDQTNFGVNQATTEWVFRLDADERITPELRQEVECVLASKSKDMPVVYSIPRRNFYFGKWVKTAGCYPDRQLRLFRNGIGQLNDEEPHNKFVFEGRLGLLASPLDHYTERTIEDHFRKFRNFTTLGARERRKRKTSVSWADLTFRPLFTFNKYFIARKGFQDGMHGFLICVFASMYTFVKYAKLWESLQNEKT